MADASHASFLPPILTFCAGAVIAVPLFRRFGLSAVLGYLAAGVVIGPSALKVISDADAIRGVAEIGVVLLLFIVGLELQPSRLFSMRKDIFGAGTAQLFISAAVIGAAAWAMGLTPLGAVAVGIALSLSATAIALQLLEERGDQGEHYGRRTFSILLFQDMAIAPILALLPLAASTGGASWTAGLSGVAIALAAIAAVVLVGRYALNPVFRILAKAGAREVMTAAALLVVLGAALLMQEVGLSMALGAFLAGVLLAESNFRHELEADIEPFRGVLLGLFFMAVGMSIDLKVVTANWLLLLVAAPLLVALKIAIAAAILRASCSSTAEAIRAGALLSPAGEFAFVLFPLAASLTLLTPTQAGLATALAAITMLIGPVVAKLIEARLAAAPRAAATMEEDFDGAGAGSVVIVGFGRFGQVVTQTMLTQAIQVTVIDKDVERIRSAARFGFRIYYGDGTRLDVLRAAGAGKARLIAVCVDDREAAKRITELAKSEFPQARVHVRAFDRVHAIDLMNIGVDRFVRETFESALYFGRITLEQLGLSPDEAMEIVLDVRRRDLERLEAQRTEGITARPDLLRGTSASVTPEPLIRPKTAARPLSEETRAAVDDAATPLPAAEPAK
jgi:monovalent cation:proton antiporter-2 (CPA2) family protein